MKASSTAEPAKAQRCAVYTRKSTDHNLDLAFNSLDAQREACEAYIKSQAHEGWCLLPGRFDDGAFSGASLERPALQSLLELVRARLVDIIVVYKVDRLTRSLADFAKLVELFDAHGVSFVSITQSFNTTSSMGRLTLNVLLSFAQFEREVIGERVRDKIAASKRKGIWVGGPVPLGYRVAGKKLEIVPEEADLVRKIFADYMRLGSIGELAASLKAEGVKPKPRQLANGSTIAAQCFMVGPLAHLLKNRFYLGEVVYKGQVYAGEHPAIVERATFEAVQMRLSEKAAERRQARSMSPALLAGKLFDDKGHAMSPSHANKQGVRYRYYVSQAVLQGRKTEAGSVPRLPAREVETLVVEALRREIVDADAGDDRAVIEKYAQRIVVRDGTIDVEISVGTPGVDANPKAFAVPYSPVTKGNKGVARQPSDTSRISAESRETLLKAIARARGWLEAILSGKVKSTEEIAAQEQLAERYVRRLLQLAFLSPRLIEAIDRGVAPNNITASTITWALSYSWSEQERLIPRLAG